MTRAPLRHVAASALIASLAVLVLAADQWTKHLALENLPYRQNVPVLGDFFSLYLTRNPGAAFSMGEGVTWIFTMAMGVVALIIVYLAIFRVRSRRWAVVLGLLLGGVLGNFTDRLFREPGFFHGHVVDFINTPWMWLGFPPAIYNIADIFIVTMMICVSILILLGAPMSRHHHEPADPTLLGKAGDEFPPDGGVAGNFNEEFPVASPYAGIPVDEVGLPPLTEAQQEAVEEEADRIADESGVGEHYRDV